MSNQYNNKVVLSNGTTLIDLTGDTVTAADVLSGKTLHLASGEPTTGTLEDGDVMSYGAAPLVGSAIVGQSALCEEEE